MSFKIHVFLGLLLAGSLLQAAPLISPFDAIKLSYPHENVNIVKKNLLLTKREASEVSKRAHVALKTKIYRIFTVSDVNTIRAFGVLISKKVRSKNAAVLYLIDAQSSTIKSIEVVAFHEPLEYLPSSTWLQQFYGKKHSDVLRTGQTIPAITGATMSARTLTNGARLALALYETVLKGKQ